MMTLKPLSSDIAQATEALGQNLAYSAPFLQYRAAEQALVADDQAYGLLRAFIRFQGELRQRQIQGTFTAADLDTWAVCTDWVITVCRRSPRTYRRSTQISNQTLRHLTEPGV
jgi:hypothetical protein